MTILITHFDHRYAALGGRRSLAADCWKELSSGTSEASALKYDPQVLAQVERQGLLTEEELVRARRDANLYFGIEIFENSLVKVGQVDDKVEVEEQAEEEVRDDYHQDTM
jgi:hypothetical protein